MTRKQRFIIRVLQTLFAIGSIIREVRDLADVYADRGYSAAGADPITQADLDTVVLPDGVTLGMTVTQLNTVAGLLAQLLNWAGGTTVTPADNEKTVNQFRTDL